MFLHWSPLVSLGTRKRILETAEFDALTIAVWARWQVVPASYSSNDSDSLRLGLQPNEKKSARGMAKIAANNPTLKIVEANEIGVENSKRYSSIRFENNECSHSIGNG